LKFSALPAIPSAHTGELLDTGKQLVPVQKDTVCQSISLESCQKHLRELEVRVAAAEHANQALLEEKIRIQNELM